MGDQPSSITKKNWNRDAALLEVPVQLTDFLEQIVIPAGLKVAVAPVREKEGRDYGAAILKIENKKILFRVSKTTPTKIGQFVTLWKRSAAHGNIVPFDNSDQFDYVIIASFEKDKRGVFIFNKALLCKQKIFSVNGEGGKLAFRVYAPWVETKAPQARVTQKWQCDYFLYASRHGDPLDLSSVEEADSIQSTLDKFKRYLK